MMVIIAFIQHLPQTRYYIKELDVLSHIIPQQLLGRAMDPPHSSCREIRCRAAHTVALWWLLCDSQYSVLRCMYYLPLVLVSDSQDCLQLKQDTVFYGKRFVNCVVYLLLIFSVSIESHLEVLQLCSQKYLQVTI